MDENIFQNVWDKLQDVLPEEWKKVIFYAGYMTGSYSMKFYTYFDDGSYKDCFSLPNVEQMQLISLFMDIDKILSKERKALGNEKWTVFTMVVDDKGNMKTDFDYTDISENAIAYEREWKKKYL